MQRHVLNVKKTQQHITGNSLDSFYLNVCIKSQKHIHKLRFFATTLDAKTKI